MAEVLGTRLIITGWRLAGRVSPVRLAYILSQVVIIAGMDTGGLKPKIWSYPTLEGKGGSGETICQPLVESLIFGDAWQDLNVTYVVLASCRPYCSQAIGSYLAKEIGPVLRMGNFEL